MKKFYISFLALCCAVTLSANETTNADELNNIAEDSVQIADTDMPVVQEDSVPDWYVAPIPYDSIFSHRRMVWRAAASTCKKDSMRSFNADSVLIEVSEYEYGDTTSTMIWGVNADGSRYGKSRVDSYTDALNDYTATYDWDKTANKWVGTTKTEYVYNSAHKMLSNTTSDWVNNDWLPLTRYTYAYDAANREIEYISYTRDAVTLQLVPTTGTIREWYNASNVNFEINYTAYTDGAWSAGTKKEYAYDTSGNKIEYILYSSYSGGKWIGSTRELWTYESGKKTYNEKQTWSGTAWVGSSKEIWKFNTEGKQTLYEKHTWQNNDWSITTQNISGYDAANNNTLVENYTYTNGVKKGSKKEEYEFNDAKKKTLTITYTWGTDDWMKNKKSVTNYDAAGNTTETANYKWSNDNWVGNGNRILQKWNSSKKLTDKITQSWSTTTNDWVNVTLNTTKYDGAKTIQEASYTWQNDDWVGTSRSDWHYNAAGLNDTIKTYTHDGTDWIYSARTINTFDASGTNIMTHKSKWNGSKWVLESMTRTDKISKSDATGRQEMIASWKCGSDSVWSGVMKDTTSYSPAGKILYTIVYESWSKGDWVPSFKIENTYDEKNNTLFSQRMNWSNNAWVGSYKNEYKYDAAGRQTMQAKYKWKDNKWYGDSKSEQTYYPSGKQQLVIDFAWSNNDWVYSIKTEYQYDDNGRLTDRKKSQFKGGVWENNQWLSEAYDSRGQKIYSHEYRWVNNDWFMITQKDYTYDEEDNKIRRETNGSWSTSGAQNSYTDYLYFYDCDIPFFTIHFVNWNGKELAQYSVQQGDFPFYDLSELGTPERPQDAENTYKFKGWTPSIVAVTGEATYTAEYKATPRTYTVTFYNDDKSVYDSRTWSYGTTPSCSEPTKSGSDQYTYKFLGWGNGILPVAGDTSYTAVFDTIVNRYAVDYYNGEQFILRDSVAYGVVPVYAGETPTKAADAQYSYTFNGWNNPLVAVKGDAIYKAEFTPTLNKYHITFFDEDGVSVKEEKDVDYGTLPTYTGETPTKAADAQYTYTFSTWGEGLKVVTKDTNYVAVYSSTLNKYTVTFFDEDSVTVIESKSWDYGTTPTCTAPTKAATAQYTYTFAGWSTPVVAVTGETGYKATYSSTVNTYSVVFYDEDSETVLDNQTLEYGAMPVYAGTTPTKAEDEQYTYEFAAWTPVIVAVTQAAEYHATYKATEKPHVPSSIEQTNESHVVKVIENGVMYILRDGKKYTLAGEVID